MNEKYEYKENDLKKVITYGTFDLLHYGHINLLKRAKALGDYLIVGVTTDSFDISRGKLNVQQSLMERIQAVKDTGLADEVIPEEYICSCSLSGCCTSGTGSSSRAFSTRGRNCSGKY